MLDGAFNRPAPLAPDVGGRKSRLNGYEWGHVAEWLRSGLQIRVPRFNSGRGLQTCFHLSPFDAFGKAEEKLFEALASAESFCYAGPFPGNPRYSAVAQW
jgi:hypothetical protein